MQVNTIWVPKIAAHWRTTAPGSPSLALAGQSVRQPGRRQPGSCAGRWTRRAATFGMGLPSTTRTSRSIQQAYLAQGAGAGRLRLQAQASPPIAAHERPGGVQCRGRRPLGLCCRTRPRPSVGAAISHARPQQPQLVVHRRLHGPQSRRHRPGPGGVRLAGVEQLPCRDQRRLRAAGALAYPGAAARSPASFDAPRSPYVGRRSRADEHRQALAGGGRRRPRRSAIRRQLILCGLGAAVLSTRAASTRFTRKLDVDRACCVSRPGPFARPRPSWSASSASWFPATASRARPIPALHPWRVDGPLCRRPGRAVTTHVAAEIELACQLGPVWQGVRQAAPHVRVLYAAFALHLAQRRQDVAGAARRLG